MESCDERYRIWATAAGDQHAISVTNGVAASQRLFEGGLRSRPAHLAAHHARDLALYVALSNILTFIPHLLPAREANLDLHLPARKVHA